MAIELAVSFVEVSCGATGCDVVFAMSESFYNARRKDHRTWYCPNGHPRVYNSQSKEEKLQAEKLQLESQLQFAREQRDRFEKKLEHQKIETRTQKGRATRFKNERDRIKDRIANGVCPCCNRHFVNVERHMTTQHPNFKIPAED